MRDEAARRRAPGELALRLASAAVLIPAGLYMVWTGGVWLAAGAGLFAAAMGYEWARMSGQRPTWLAALLASLPNLVVPLATFGAGLAVLLIAAIGFAAVNWRAAPMAAFGLLYAGGMPLALQVLRGGPWDGQAAALIFMAIVWASDSAAYFAGRGFGGPPLSPRDSPNKTWSGALGAIACCALCGVIAAGLLGAAPLPWAISGAAVSALAQLGDLFESQLKRRYGVKDASGLVPGHGGVMDRVDSLGAVCVGVVVVFLGWPEAAARLGF